MGSSQSSLRPAVELISHWHLDSKDRVIFDSGTTEITQYFKAVDKIIQSAHRDELQEFISMIVARFKSEFLIVLTRQTESAMGSTSLTQLSTSISDSTSYQFHYEDYVLYDAPRSYVVDYLRRVVEIINDCGHLRVLTEVYVSVRKQFVDWIIKKLRFEELLAGNTKKFLGEDLKMKTERWVQAAKICFKLLFPREKQIAKQIFDGFGNSIADESFMHIVNDVMFNLLRFAENVISSKLTSEKLEIVLILCNAFLSIAPDVNALFQFESGQRARNTIEKILSGLHDEVRRMLSDFVNGVFNDTSKIVDKGEAVLPFTKYVMGYLNHPVNHKILLMDVIVTRPSMTSGSMNFPDDVLQETGNLSPLSLHVVLIIAVLLLNLEAKGKKHKNENPLFGYELFMMNNIQFIVQKITGSKDLQEMVGPDYVKKLKNSLNNTMDQFQALACDNLLNCLKEEELYVSHCFCRRRVSTRSLRKQVKKFNSICENMHVVQSSEIIQDTSMREELCRLTKKMLVPAYGSFLDKFKNHLNFQNNSKSRLMSFRKVSIKYTVEDLNDLVSKHYQLSSSKELPAEGVHV